MPEIRLIAAVDDKRGLARENKIPWRLPTDSQYFQDKTRSQPVLVGKRTFEQMGPKALAAQYSFIYLLSREDGQVENGLAIRDLQAFVSKLTDDIWVIGGGQVYAQMLPYATELYITHVRGDFGCDVFFPEFEDKFSLVREDPIQTENGIEFSFQLWRPNPR